MISMGERMNDQELKNLLHLMMQSLAELTHEVRMLQTRTEGAVAQDEVRASRKRVELAQRTVDAIREQLTRV